MSGESSRAMIEFFGLATYLSRKYENDNEFLEELKLKIQKYMHGKGDEYKETMLECYSFLSVTIGVFGRDPRSTG